MATLIRHAGDYYLEHDDGTRQQVALTDDQRAELERYDAATRMRELRYRRRRTNLVDPTRLVERVPVMVLLGLDDQWDGPDAVGPHDGRPCPACGRERMKPLHYCLECDRCGLEHLLRPVPPSERPRRPPSEDGLKGGLG